MVLINCLLRKTKMAKRKKNETLKSTVDVEDDLNRLVCVLVITNKGLRETLKRKLINDARINYIVVMDAKDLNYKPSPIFETQMYDHKQEVFLLICRNERVHSVMEVVRDQNRLLLESKSQVLSFPLSSMINYKLFQFLSATPEGENK